MTEGLLRKRAPGETRTLEQIREHYRVERELADRLRQAAAHERGALYAAVYDELFRRVPHHSQLVRKAAPEETRRRAGRQVRWLRRFMGPDSVFLEIGPGDCVLSFAAAEHARRVIAVDVSDEITRQSACPANFELILSDGTSLPVPEGSVDLAYSDQLMEHLHPDDAMRQLRNVQRALAPGGRYICITPNRLGGPWDISRYFDPVASGFHLREYTFTELADLFKQAGFRRVRPYIGGRGLYLRLPVWAMRLMESVLSALPDRLRRALTDNPLAQIALGIQVVAEK